MNKNWKMSVICGISTFFVLILIYLFWKPGPSDSYFLLAYNFSFMLPVIIFLSFFGVRGYIYFDKFKKEMKEPVQWYFKTIPVIFLLPITIQTVYILLVILYFILY